MCESDAPHICPWIGAKWCGSEGRALARGSTEVVQSGWCHGMSVSVIKMSILKECE